MLFQRFKKIGRTLQHAARLRHVAAVLFKYGYQDIARRLHLPLARRLIFRRFREEQASIEKLSQAVRLRLACEELGPTFIKLGQLAASRTQTLPHEFTDELAKLQDQVPPFEGRLARHLIDTAYGRPLGEIFSSFDETPLAAASIAQVHVATLRDNQREVIVKVLRPGMRAVIGRDLEVLHALAGLAKRNSTEARRLRVDEVVEEYEKTILDELDLMREAANAAQLRRNFENSDLLHVPEVFWDHCRVDVMVMERIHGVTISNMTALRAVNANIRLLAENGVKIFFTQVFRHNFFHADMHP